MARPWALGIDFGTSFTVAAGRAAGESAEVIEIDGARRTPSIVFVDADDRVVVGQVAEEMQASRPDAVLRAPKARLGEPAPVILAGRPRQITALVGQVLATALAAGTRSFGSAPTQVRLTHPAAWTMTRLSRLNEAALAGGLHDPTFVPEPVAAASSYWKRGDLPTGGHVAIYDLGGGTFDVAILRVTPDGFEIEGRPGGETTIGGELFDEMVAAHLGERLPAATWESIQVSQKPAWQHARLALSREARRAKESLSSYPYADVLLALPTGLEQLRITRAEFDVLVGLPVDDTMTVMDRCIAEAGLRPDQLSAIQLVGGASYSPIVEQVLGERFPGVPVHRRGDPKASVAIGALLAPDHVARRLDGSAVVPVPPTPVAPTPVPATPVAPTPIARPVPPPPNVPPPPSRPPVVVTAPSSGPAAARTTSAPPPTLIQAATPAARRRRKWPLVLTLLVLLGAGGGAAAYVVSQPSHDASAGASDARTTAAGVDASGNCRPGAPCAFTAAGGEVFEVTCQGLVTATDLPLHQCHKGDLIELVQQRLAALAYDVDVDRQFGPNTLAGVVRFQRDRGLNVDGIVGFDTWKALFSGASLRGTDRNHDGVIVPSELS